MKNIMLPPTFSLTKGVSATRSWICRFFDLYSSCFRRTPSVVVIPSALQLSSILFIYGEERIRLVTRRSGVEDRLKSAMEIKSAFAPKQKEFIHTWSEEWNFGEDMIMLAYDITVNSTGKSRLRCQSGYVSEP